MENSTPASVPVNVAYFSDGNFLRDLGKLEGKMDALEKTCGETCGETRQVC